MLLTFKHSYGIISEITIKAITTMKLIEDLGTRVTGNKGHKVRYGLYECPACHKHFECQVVIVKSGRTTKCRGCANKAMATKAAEMLIEKAKAIHGDLYEYLLVNYTNTRTKVKITCKIHGEFLQTPHDHLKGQGCPHCAISGFSKSKPAIVYYLKVTHNNIVTYKIGITNRSVQERFSNEDLEKITIIKVWDYLIGAEAYNHEQQILKQYKDYKYIGEPLLNSGNTELFSIDILGLSTTLK